MYTLTFNDKTMVKNPTFIRTKKGRINIFENKQINLETEYLPDSEVSIDANLKELDKFKIGSEGIFVAMKSKSDEIKINGKNKTRSYLDVLLENKALALIVGFIIIVADKWILILFQKNSSPGSTSPNTKPRSQGERVRSCSNTFNTQ